MGTNIWEIGPVLSEPLKCSDSNSEYDDMMDRIPTDVLLQFFFLNKILFVKAAAADIAP